MNTSLLRSAHPIEQPRLNSAALSFAQQVQGVIGAAAMRINDRFEAILHDACHFFRMDYAVITLAGKGRVKVVASVGVTVPRPSFKAAVTAPTLTQALLSERAVIVLAEANGMPCQILPALTGTVPARFIGVPLLFDGVVFGTLELSGHRAGLPLSETELATAYFLASTFAAPLALMGD